MSSLAPDVSELLLAYDPDFVELETAPLLLDDTSLQGVVPAVLGGAEELGEEICPEGRYDDFITSLRAFLRDKKIGGGFDWDAVVITGPELFSTRPGSRDRVEADEEAAEAPEEILGAYQNEFDSEEESDGDDEFFARTGGGSILGGRRFATAWGAADGGDETGSVSLESLVVELPEPLKTGEADPADDAFDRSAHEEIFGAMDETEAEAEAEPLEAEAEPLEKGDPVAWGPLVEDPGWGSAPTQSASLLQYIVPAAPFAEGSLSLSQ